MRTWLLGIVHHRAIDALPCSFVHERRREDARTVVATTRAPGADVRLEIGDGGSMLVAKNMPAPPQDRIYQVWLKRPGRDPEPTSALWSTRGDGSAQVAVPGSLDGVEAVLVTDEPPAARRRRRSRR